MTDLVLRMYDFWDAGMTIHPLEAFRALGISCEEAEPQPMADQWMLRGCTNLPEVLPVWLEVVGKRRDEGSE